MTLIVTKIAPPCDLSMGVEDEGLFSALMWPDELGNIPFKDKIIACVVPDGFVLMGEPDEEVVAFIGFGSDVMAEFAAGTVTIMRFLGDDYETRDVNHGQALSASELDFRQAA
jgi:hypothetical protein